jgi:hypothetical protein
LITVALLCFAAGFMYFERKLNARSAAWGATAVDLDGAALPFAWPPRVGEPFPELVLVSATGEQVALSRFKGKVVLIETVGMNCPACNAFAGAHQKGGYAGTRPQEGLPSIEKLLQRFAGGLELDHEDLVLVHLLLFDPNYAAPDADDAREWASHFAMHERRDVHVLAGGEALLNRASYDMIPGFFLVDRDFVLRADSTGHKPRHDLYRELLPMVPELVEG